jgi:hypothetical protein
MKKIMTKNLTQGLVITLILCWLGWHMAVPVDLVRSDLGRHIKNGELIWHGAWDVLYKNYYSYTNPEHPFINYHWLFGVFCYVLLVYFGFGGLSLIYLLLQLLAFYLFFLCARKYVSLAAACAVGLLSFPLIAFRSEVRPEGLSYLFCAVFWWLADSYQCKRLKSAQLWISVCLLQIIWANTHVLFMMGPLLAVIFWLQARMNGQRQQADTFRKLFVLLLGMCLINPFGARIFSVLSDTWHEKTSLPIIESLPVVLVLKENLSAYKPVLVYFLVTAVILVSALIVLIKREGLKKYVLAGSLALIVSMAAMKANRMIGLYGYFWIPISAYVYHRLTQAQTVRFRKNFETVLVAIGLLISVFIHFDFGPRPGLGVVAGCDDAAEFFKREKLTGPIFNNYGIGGYLIFHLSPDNKVFIDNRGVAAYPGDFVLNTYEQMQRADVIWHQLDQEYHFNVIFCFPESSSWGRVFLANRLMDRDWALVFFSAGVMIFVKRSAQNLAVIKRNEIQVRITRS